MVPTMADTSHKGDMWERKGGGLPHDHTKLRGMPPQHTTKSNRQTYRGVGTQSRVPLCALANGTMVHESALVPALFLHVPLSFFVALLPPLGGRLDPVKLLPLPNVCQKLGRGGPVRLAGWGGIWDVRNLGSAKFGVEKIWHQFLNTTEKLGANLPDCGTRSIDCEWWLLFPMGLWLVAVISILAWHKQRKQCIAEHSNQCVHPKVSTGTLASPFFGTPTPPQR